MKLVERLKTLPKYYLTAFVILFVWELLLLIKKSHWTIIVFLVIGSIIGHLLMEIDWIFLKNKDLAKIIPIILFFTPSHKSCQDEMCFIDMANECEKASLTQNIEGTTFELKTSNCKLIKKNKKHLTRRTRGNNIIT